MSLVRRRGAVAGARSAGGPVTADIAATLPALEQSATGTALVAGAVSGDIAATLPALTQSAAGSVEVRGDIAATLPALTQAATGTVPADATLVASTTGTSDAVNAPTHVDGDVLVLFVTDLTAVPVGWTGIGPLGDNPLWVVAAWKVASSEPASYNFGGSGRADIHAYRNVDTTDPIVDAERADPSTSGKTLTVLGVDVLAGGIRVVGFGHATFSGRTLADLPSPFTTLHNSGDGTRSLVSGYVAEAADGTSADVTVEVVSGESNANLAAVHFSLRPN